MGSMTNAKEATSIKPSKRISKSRRAKIQRVIDRKDPESVVGKGHNNLADI